MALELIDYERSRYLGFTSLEPLSIIKWLSKSSEDTLYRGLKSSKSVKLERVGVSLEDSNGEVVAKQSDTGGEPDSKVQSD